MCHLSRFVMLNLNMSRPTVPHGPNFRKIESKNILEAIQWQKGLYEVRVTVA